MSCPECGFDGDTVSPSDAAAALRSYPRRYAAVLTLPDDNEAYDPLRRAGADGWSAMAHAWWAALAFDAITEALHQVLIHDHPDVSEPAIMPAAPPPVDEPNEAVLDRLTRAAPGLAVAIDNVRGADQWNRTGRLRDGSEVTALDLVRTGVHQGVHHLRAAERVVKEVTGRPAG